MKSTIAGVILCAPLLTIDTTYTNSWLSPFKDLLIKYLPRFKLSSYIDIEALSRDKEVIRDFISDPLIMYKPLSVKQLYTLDKIINESITLASSIHWSYIILHGTLDKISNFTGSQLFYAKTPATEKSLYVLDGFYHDILHDYDYEEPYNFILKYADTRCLITKAISVVNAQENTKPNIQQELHQTAQTIL